MKDSVKLLLEVSKSFWDLDLTSASSELSMEGIFPCFQFLQKRTHCIVSNDSIHDMDLTCLQTLKIDFFIEFDT